MTKCEGMTQSSNTLCHGHILPAVFSYVAAGIAVSLLSRVPRTIVHNHATTHDQTQKHLHYEL